MAQDAPAFRTLLKFVLRYAGLRRTNIPTHVRANLNRRRFLRPQPWRLWCRCAGAILSVAESWHPAHPTDEIRAKLRAKMLLPDPEFPKTRSLIPLTFLLTDCWGDRLGLR